ncbi:MAG: hypothetical protein GY708_00275 [Actinomycetia bacterium]|nr:hypothetical protein [Actinomycetes bacterium]
MTPNRFAPRGAALLVLTLLCSTFVGVDAASGAEEDGSIAYGASVRGSQFSLLQQLETDLDRELDVVRVFKLWNDDFPTADDSAILDGRDMLLSIRPKQNGNVVPWADIAAAQPGETLYEDMVSWAQNMEPYEDQIHLTFQHEPETTANLASGGAADFIAAWRRFMEVMAVAGFEPVNRVWIMTDYSFHVPEWDRRHAQDWYPGDNWVDAIAGDAYNWYQCRDGINTPWMSLAEIIEPMRQFGQDHPDKELMLTEVASAEDPADPSRKGEWVNDAQTMFADPIYDQFTTIASFNVVHSWTADCVWYIDSSPASLAAFQQLADDPLFGGDGAGDPDPDPGCQGVREGNQVSLSWTDNGGEHVVRRNNGWLATPGANASSYVDTGAPQGASYTIRTWSDGVFVDRACELENQPQDGCEVVVAGGSASLTWPDDGGFHVVRRNDRWLGSPGFATTSFVDTAAPGGATYSIRTWAANGFSDRECVVAAN